MIKKRSIYFNLEIIAVLIMLMNIFVKDTIISNCVTIVMIIASIALSIVVKLFLAIYDNYNEKDLLTKYEMMNKYDIYDTIVMCTTFKSMMLIVNVIMLSLGAEINLKNVMFDCCIIDLVGAVLIHLSQRSFLRQADNKNGLILIVTGIVGLLLNIMFKVVNMTKPLLIISILSCSFYTFIMVYDFAIKYKDNKSELMTFIILEAINQFMQVLTALGFITSISWHALTQFNIIVVITFSSFNTYYKIPVNQQQDESNRLADDIRKLEHACETIVNLSHELKTPVNVIKSAVDMLVLDNPEDIKELQCIKEDCNLIMNLIQDMIDTQKIKTRSIEIVKKKYNIVEVVDNVVDAFQNAIPNFDLLFEPHEEEICQRLDINLFQKGIMILIGQIYDDPAAEIEMQQKDGYIIIDFRSINVSKFMYIHELFYKITNGVDYVNDSLEDKYIQELMSYKLFDLILREHNALLKFGDKDQMSIILEVDEGDTKLAWPDEIAVAVLNDQVTCRYKR